MRSGPSKKRQTQTDSSYKSRAVTRVTNVVMQDGKKSTAQKIVYGAMEKLSQDKKESLLMFEQALRNVMPAQEIRSRRVGGATYQVPMPVKHDRAEALAARWIVGAARGKKGKPMEQRLYEEFKDAYNGTGSAMKKREEVHKMAEANKAFAHFGRFN